MKRSENTSGAFHDQLSTGAMLNSNLLRCFLGVLEHRTLTEAAEDLCISQPALSKSLRRLEDELGVSLFDRTPTGMVPTAYGLALAHRARMIQLESDRARNELQQLQQGGIGSLTIGTGPLWSAWVLPEVIADLSRSYAKLHVRVVAGVLDTLMPQLLKGEIDVVCAALDFPEHEDLSREVLIDSAHVILAHASHPLANLATVSPIQLSQCKFVGQRNDYAVLERMERYFAMRGLRSPGFVVEAGSLEMLLSLVQTGEFVATQSNQLLTRAQTLGIRALPVADSFWRFQGGVVYRSRPAPGPAIEIFCAALRNRLRATPTSHA